MAILAKGTKESADGDGENAKIGIDNAGMSIEHKKLNEED